ncbi:unnamed protein product, partial [marine sediment metagenome]
EWRHIPGIAYRSGSEALCGPPRPLVADLDELPFPARDYVPFIKRELAEHGVVSVAASRGCYGNCGFCAIRQFYREPGGPPCRLRSIRNVIDEIEQIVGVHGVSEILLIDDIFTFPGQRGAERVGEWRRELAARGLRVMLSISDRVDHIRRPLYDELYKMGVRQIMVGVEATDPEILRYFNKGITVEDVRRALGVLDQLGIDVTITYINFTPMTTLEILRDNLACLLSFDVNFLPGLLNRLQVYVGTPIADDLIGRGMVTGTFPEFSYRIPDERVEVVYEVCCECLHPFLEVSYEIMKLERMFRVKAFRMEGMGRPDPLLAEGKAFFRRRCGVIMKEAADIFRTLLDYAGTHEGVEDAFLARTAARASEAYRRWHRELELIRDRSPLFDDADRIVLR